MTPQELENRLINFSSRIIKLVSALPNEPVGKHLGGQLLRSGTSPALNYGEARGAESTADFIHKKKVCLKELRESHNNIRIIQQQNWFSEGRLESIIKENDELISIFVASVKTAETKRNKKKNDKDKK